MAARTSAGIKVAAGYILTSGANSSNLTVLQLAGYERLRLWYLTNVGQNGNSTFIGLPRATRIVNPNVYLTPT